MSAYPRDRFVPGVILRSVRFGHEWTFLKWAELSGPFACGVFQLTKERPHTNKATRLGTTETLPVHRLTTELFELVGGYPDGSDGYW